MTALDSLLSRQPWLITTDAMQGMVAQAVAFFDARIQLPDASRNALLSVSDGIGIIDLHGPLMRQPDLISSLLFGATDMDLVTAAIAEAVARDDVQSILIDINSPGGTVNGTPELAQAVADAAKLKTTYAFSAGQMCSAAYWIASQCDAIYATPSARVGSIGVMLPFIDSTEKFRSEGLKVEVFAAGKFKGMATPGVPLSEEQRALIQSDIEEIAAEFKTAVLARGRKIPDSAMEGQSFSARNAQRLNLAGMVKSRDEVLSRLRSMNAARVDTPSRTSTPMKTAEEQLSEALARIQTLEADAKAREGLMAEASTQVETFKATLLSKEQEHQALLQQACTERDTLKGQLVAAQADVERFTKRSGELDVQVRDLQSREQDLEKRAAIKAAQIAAEMGTQVPAKITPAGDTKPATAAEQWNRQFTKA
ncbi:MAG: S49 family peptidase [Prosthecobacter sp.]|uniref:S49 family peptidase n=1 Tax=Prosthecobacter sp. TaxID=1965333 RepID=UPI0025DD5EEA|nr:S49 family peptidase [Prosthecobacter sp.]MCF7787786.1 S49 family peptidase [Prosthecobacter sp.]